MRHTVLLTEGAERDLEAIFDYIASTDSPHRASRLLGQLMAAAGKLSELPGRGAIPPELLALGIRDYRQVHFKPYRLIYRVMQRRAIIYVIADSRRDLPALLARRLLQSD